MSGNVNPTTERCPACHGQGEVPMTVISIPGGVVTCSVCSGAKHISASSADIVERLRRQLKVSEALKVDYSLKWEAADEIERLRSLSWDLLDALCDRDTRPGGLGSAVLHLRSALGERNTSSKEHTP